MNKAEVIDKIVEKTSLSKSEVEKVISSFFETIKSSLKDKQNVRLVGFGTFSSNERKARVGRNPQTGEEINIPSCCYPKFKPGKEFKDYLN
ncbi:MAG: HU family DNA-binding protein [Oligoflexia bacterium]|nr:HU family DNA-binding protein [Oligoflexia bacterium]